MSDVTLTIDGQEVTVPAGTGLVEAAEELGVEIPVFCYEPRIGPAVGACRMCLVEIEGVPKLQAACATAVRPGMVVSTVSDKARDAQESILEFLLINHPLDCPVCDKGGECPLQDQAYRWGPGSSRFTEAKRVNDKPIPISPLIALDRERCILCYRCTRYSAEVTEDLELIARQRGANSVIATFEGRPWEGTHAGNVIELCPVGALTSTQFRFRARPWEAPDHPSVAMWDPVGSNIYNTIREGRVVRVLSRRNDAVDVGWIDDRTRFSYEALNTDARITAARVGAAAVSHEVAMEELFNRISERRLWQAPEGDESTETAPTGTLFVLSGYETLEAVYAVQQLAKASQGKVVAVPGGSAALPASSAKIADLAKAKQLVVVGSTDLLDDAPALELWIRKARQHGAAVTVAGIGGTRIDAKDAQIDHVLPGEFDAWAEQFAARQQAGDSMVIVHRDGELSNEAIAKLAPLVAGDDSGFLAIPKTANARGLAAMGVETAEWSEIFAHNGGVVYIGVDPARSVDQAIWQAGVRKHAWSAAVDLFETPLHALVDIVVPAAGPAEQDGSLVNLEGRLQRITVGASPADAIRPLQQWAAGLARRMGERVQGSAASAYRQLVEASPAGRFPVASHNDIPAEGILGVSGGSAAKPVSAPALPTLTDDQFALHVVPFIYDAIEVENTPAMSFLREQATVVTNRADARSRGLKTNDLVNLKVDGRTVEARVKTTRALMSGHLRIHAATGGFAAGRTGIFAASLEPVTSSVTKTSTTEAGA